MGAACWRACPYGWKPLVRAVVSRYGASGAWVATAGTVTAAEPVHRHDEAAAEGLPGEIGIPDGDVTSLFADLKALKANIERFVGSA